MKKTIALLLALMMSVSVLAACSSGGDSTQPEQQQQQDASGSGPQGVAGGNFTVATPLETDPAGQEPEPEPEETEPAEPDPEETSGELTYTYENGVLTISGNGYLGGDSSGIYDEIYNFIMMNLEGSGEDFQVVIEEGVTGFAPYLFTSSLGERRVTSVTIPGSVTVIEPYAFDWCGFLESVTIQEGVTEIEQYAFNDCGSLTSVTIPASVTKIESGAFKGCSSLTSVTLLNPDTVVEENAFPEGVSIQQ